MKNNKKNLKYLAFVLLVLLVGIIIARSFNKVGKDEGADLIVEKDNKSEKNYVLDGYPLEIVPLYELQKISSMKYFVNDDPLNYESYFDKNRNYYNVVFYSNASQKDVLDYYRSLMSEINPESTENRVEGVIGDYKVSASHYGEDSSTVYLQVYMPSLEYSKVNPYYSDYESLVEVPDSWIEHESSFGLLNQAGGQKEYTRYFNLEDDSFENLYNQYSEELSNKKDFTANDETNTLTWKEGNTSITLVFESSHGRIYYMERQSF